MLAAILVVCIIVGYLIIDGKKIEEEERAAGKIYRKRKLSAEEYFKAQQDFLNTPVPLPSLNQQKIIDAILDTAALGQGTFTYDDGRVYVGEWKDGKIYKGTYTDADGNEFLKH